MSRINIRVDRPYRGQVDKSLLRAAAQRALGHEGASGPAALTVVVTGDEQVRALNRDYLGLDKTTDVLSFGQKPGSRFMQAPDEAPYLGDIIISFPRAQAQASRGGHPVAHELALLVVHGVLHLLGHDHAGRAEKRRMWAAQDEVLGELGVRVKVTSR